MVKLECRHVKQVLIRRDSWQMSEELPVEIIGKDLFEIVVRIWLRLDLRRPQSGDEMRKRTD
jgi:hypothetical protein